MYNLRIYTVLVVLSLVTGSFAFAGTQGKVPAICQRMSDLYAVIPLPTNGPDQSFISQTYLKWGKVFSSKGQFEMEIPIIFKNSHYTRPLPPDRLGYKQYLLKEKIAPRELGRSYFGLKKAPV